MHFSEIIWGTEVAKSNLSTVPNMCSSDGDHTTLTVFTVAQKASSFSSSGNVHGI